MSQCTKHHPNHKKEVPAALNATADETKPIIETKQYPDPSLIIADSPGIVQGTSLTTGIYLLVCQVGNDLAF